MKCQRGFSLVELMIALVLGLIVSVAIFTLFVSTLKSNKTHDNLSRLQESARYALYQLQNDLRMTGYRSCLGRKGSTADVETAEDVNLISGIQYHNDFDQSIQGFHAQGSSWTPALDASISSASPTQDSDIITVRFATGQGTHLSAIMANGTADIPILSNPDNLTTSDDLIIADCAQSTVFSPTSISATTIAHSSAANTSDNLGRAYSTDAVVMPIKTVTYFVAPSQDVSNGSSLWRKTNADAAEELADNIEQLKILYGEDTNGDLAPDKYVTANQVADMKNVIAIKLMLLARTLDDDLSASGQQYTFNGVKVSTPTDKYIRRVYNMTVTIRNRAT